MVFFAKNIKFNKYDGFINDITKNMEGKQTDCFHAFDKKSQLVGTIHTSIGH
jgi:hypothetical protein